MSAGDDNIFARWSRRKQAARQPGPAEAPQPTEARAAVETAEPLEAQAVEAEPAETELVPAEATGSEGAEPEALPRLEDLDAGSDVSAFLRKGVPTALRNGALRRMWSLDTGIRDYIGPSEYAWDFNTPGSMAGFGPLEANSAVVDFLSKVARSVLPGTEEAPTEAHVTEAGQAAEPKNANPSKVEESASPKSTAEGEAGDSQADTEAEREQSEPTPEVAALAEASSAKKPAFAESAQEPARPRHGGAMPR